jgi:hypothetical protein
LSIKEGEEMSKYIIEDAQYATDETNRRISLLVEDNRIAAIRNSFLYYNHIRMNISPFIMTPSHVICDTCLPADFDFPSFKTYFLSHFISKGCTTILTSFSITYEFEFLKKLEERKTTLLSSPIDYTIGLLAPAHLITPGVIRLCKRNRVPVIWMVLDDLDAFSSVKWGWIKGLLYDYRITFVPFFTTKLDKKQKMKHLRIWQKTMTSENIPHISEEMKQKVPLPLSQLKKIGMYPHRGNFLPGGEISYNLYMKKETEESLDDSLFHYESHVLKCTMNRGKYHYLNGQSCFHPGAGKELKIQTPGFFT